MNSLQQKTVMPVKAVTRALLLLCALLTGISTAAAQSVPLDALEMNAILDQYEDPYLIVSGPTVYGRMASTQATNLGRISLLPLLFTSYRMLDRGQMDIDAPISQYLPDLELDEPYSKPVTIRHLLAETAGFAVPPWLTPDGREKLGAGIRLDQHHDPGPYLKRLRGSGNMTHPDPIGWFLLTRVLEAVSGQDIISLFNTDVALPLGLGADAFFTGSDMAGDDGTYQGPAFLETVLALHTSPEGVRALAQALASNRQADGRPYLGVRARISLVEQPAWQLHPLGPGRTLGFASHWLNDRKILSLGSWPCLAGSGISSQQLDYFPSADLVIIAPATSVCSGSGPTALLQQLAEAFIPPQDRADATKQAASLRIPEKLAGNYMLDTAPSAWLSLRLDRLKRDVIHMKRTTGGLEVERHGHPPVRFREVGPLAYQSHQGARLFVGEAAEGGHIHYNGDYYRYVGAMGSKKLMLTPMPWVLIIVFSGVIYAFNRHDRAWRRMGQFCGLGVLLFVGGVWMELTLWPQVWLEQDGFWTVTAWRTLLNIGLMMIVAVIFFSVSFSRSDKMPAGYWLVPASLHLTLLAAAAAVTTLLAVAWGIAGTIFPH